MNHGMLQVPDFDADRHWGAFLPAPVLAGRLRVAHALPAGLSPLARWLRRPIARSSRTPIDLVIWGMKLRLLPRGNLSEQKFYTAPRHFDRDERAVLKRRLRPGSVFVDIGANAGIYSFWAHHCMQGRGTIIAVEPDPEMRRRLEFNIATNALTDIRLSPLALSDREGRADLLVNPRQRGQNTLEAGEAQQAGGKRTVVPVQVTTLLNLLRSQGVTRCDALKIDIEGHEPPVLRHFLTHAPESLWPHVLISEFKNQTAGDILALLAARGYTRRETTRRNFIFERTS